MQYSKVIDRLHHQSNWRLFWLNFFTLGIYSGFYIKRQTETINSYLDDHQRLSLTMANILIILKFVALIWGSIIISSELSNTVLYESGSVEVTYAGDSLDWIITILMWIWAFQIRDRLHDMLSIKHDDYKRFSAVWTFFFPLLYFNYKINRLYEYMNKYPDEKSPIYLP